MAIPLEEVFYNKIIIKKIKIIFLQTKYLITSVPMLCFVFFIPKKEDSGLQFIVR